MPDHAPAIAPADPGQAAPPPRQARPAGPSQPLRLEKATIPLALVAAGALGLGAHFYSQLVVALRDVGSEVRVTREAINAINTRVAVIESARLDERMRALEVTATRNGTRIEALERASAGGGR